MSPPPQPRPSLVVNIPSFSRSQHRHQKAKRKRTTVRRRPTMSFVLAEVDSPRPPSPKKNFSMGHLDVRSCSGGDIIIVVVTPICCTGCTIVFIVQRPVKVPYNAVQIINQEELALVDVAGADAPMVIVPGSTTSSWFKQRDFWVQGADSSSLAVTFALTLVMVVVELGAGSLFRFIRFFLLEARLYQVVIIIIRSGGVAVVGVVNVRVASAHFQMDFIILGVFKGGQTGQTGPNGGRTQGHTFRQQQLATGAAKVER
ncbi:hypothetical protein TYRP_007845 [Tyrophagus putrescentiae]|nr:hypothetical protein TYRP_007845 [Tyrophagus putrescentiae]